MKRILGLDLGTSSIGWAVVDQAVDQQEKSRIIKLGVRVNPLTTDEKGNFEKGKSITTTADRTLKRGMRRSLQRYKLRRDELIKVLKANAFITENSILSEDGNNTTFETYRLRAKAAREEVTLEELARVLLMINKKRGYKSNRKANDSTSDSENGEAGELIDGMEVALKLHEENITPGDYVYSLLKKNHRGIPNFYRSDLEAELDLVWKKQEQFYPEILTQDIRKKMVGKGKTETGKLFYAIHKIYAAEEKDKKLKLLVPFRWRSEATKQQLPVEQVVAVIAMINGDIRSSSGYLSAISDHSKELYFNKQTVGEYLWSELQRNPHARTKGVVFYRQDYIDEFNTIWETQQKFHEQLTDSLKEELRDIIIFYQRRLKSKKGLISFCELEGKEITIVVDGKEKKVKSGPRVCPKSSPLFQEFKIWQELNILKLSTSDNNSIFGESTYSLNAEQRQILFRELSYSTKLSKAQICKILHIKPKDVRLNYEELHGNSTGAALMKACKKIIEMSGHDAENFDKLTVDEKLQQVEQILPLLGGDTAFMHFDATSMEHNAMFKLWHLLYSYEGDNSKTGIEQLKGHVMAITALPQEYAAIIAGVNFEDDYGALSSKAIKKILPYLEKGLVYSEACEQAGYRHSAASLTKEEIEARELVKQMDLLPKNSLRNPVVEKILNQMIWVVNACSEEYGPFDEIHIEMARSLKQSQEQRDRATKKLTDRTKESENIKKILQGAPFNIARPSRNDIIRYRLYLELESNGYKTLYSNTYISKERLFTRDFDIEHIIPQAKIFDDSFTNKTIEARQVNIDKSSQTAFDFVASQYGETELAKYRQRVIALFDQTNKAKKERLLMTEKDIPSDFLNRDLSDSQYIAREAKRILSQITRVVVPTIGSITARLREDWQLVNVMQELNWNKYNQLGLTEEYENRDGHKIKKIKDWTKRNDHRHHAMDALTIAFTQLGHIQLLNHLNTLHGDKAQQRYLDMKQKYVNERRFIPPMPLNEFRAQALKHLDAILVSIKAKNKVATLNVNKTKSKEGIKRQKTFTPRAQMHNETIYGNSLHYEAKMERVGASFDEHKIGTVACKAHREALLKRLQQFGGNAKKAFTGKNALDKNPIFLDNAHIHAVPLMVKTVTQERMFTIRKPISPDPKVMEQLIKKSVDKGVKNALERRLEQYNQDYKAAFSNIDENPIWLNEEKGIAVKSITIKGVNEATPLHEKCNKDGAFITQNGRRVPADYVSTSNNHHVAIFEDADGNLQEHIVSFFEAMACVNQGLPVVDKHYNRELGWKFLFTMKQNEYFVIPDIEHGFNPSEIDLKDECNYPLISKHLYRVQKLSTKDYVFRHHLETTVEDNNTLKGVTWVRITGLNNLKGFIKVRVNHIGKIVDIGEY